VEAIKKVSKFIQSLKIKGIELEYLNIGGGLGIIYDHESPQTAEIYAKEIIPLLKKTGLKVIMEPGRFIVGNAGILVVKVLYIKHTLKKKFIIVDGGMNDLIRPALYSAYHNVWPLVKNLKTEKADIVGPICESGDFLAKDRLVAKVKESDYLGVMSAGAYGFSMSSNYNSRPRCAEVMVVKGKVLVIRQRESAQDLVRNEIAVNNFTKL
jgi:diaminopimelate decarboxylase